MKIDVSIITVGYRSEKTIIPFLDSIKKSRDPLKKEVIIVDNYPADKGANLAQKHPLMPTVIRNTENVGFAKAINQALYVANGRYIFITNPDTRLVGSALEKLVTFAKKMPRAGAVAPKLLNNDGQIQPSCFRFPNVANAIKHYFFGVKNAFNKYYPGDQITTVDVAVMAAFLVPKSVIDHIGGLDEKYFLYYEDVEYCYRLKHYGYKIYYYPEAKVKHAHGASGSFTSHLSSPLAKSAQIYHGKTGSFLLNTVLRLGQKWQKILKKIKK